MRLCQYKNIFGEPGRGVHKLRIGPFAFVDLVGTLVIAGLIGYFFNVDVLLTFIILFVVAQFLHWLFCSKTAFLKMIGLA